MYILERVYTVTRNVKMKHIYFVVLSCFCFWSTASADEIEIIEVTQTPPEPTKPSPPGGIVRSPSNPGAGSPPPYEMPPEDSLEKRMECRNAELSAREFASDCVATIAEKRALANKYCSSDDREKSLLDSLTFSLTVGFKIFSGTLGVGFKADQTKSDCREQLTLNADASTKRCLAFEAEWIADACSQ